jgi:oligoribonuclease NrnB/cAMP/cGMP phosphodiesterase (DHH superfamily)
MSINNLNDLKNLKYDIIIYHNPCSDGVAAAWVVKHFIPTAELIPCFAGKTPSNDIQYFYGKKIIFVDICPNKEYLMELKNLAEYITILDHHITAYKNLENISEENINYVFNNNLSGCMIAWNYFSNEEMPWFLSYIGDRDLWKWELPYSKEINTVLFEDDHTNFKGLTKLFDTPFDDNLYKSFAERGKILVEFKDKLIKTAMKSAIHSKYKNKKIWLYTCPPDILSEVGNALMDKNFKDNQKPDFAVCWRYNVMTHEYYISMRSNAISTDVSEICKELGGGGHRNAAGCTLSGNTILRNFFIPFNEE